MYCEPVDCHSEPWLASGTPKRPFCLCLVHHRQSAAFSTVYTYLACWLSALGRRARSRRVKRMADEVVTRSSQDDKTVPRSDRRLHTSSRGLICPELLDCSPSDPSPAKGPVSWGRLPMKHRISGPGACHSCLTCSHLLGLLHA